MKGEIQIRSVCPARSHLPHLSAGRIGALMHVNIWGPDATYAKGETHVCSECGAFFFQAWDHFAGELKP